MQDTSVSRTVLMNEQPHHLNAKRSRLSDTPQKNPEHCARSHQPWHIQLHSLRWLESQPDCLSLHICHCTRLQHAQQKDWTSIGNCNFFLIFIIATGTAGRKELAGFDSAGCPTQIHQNIAGLPAALAFHFDVSMAVVWSLERVMKGKRQRQVLPLTFSPTISNRLWDGLAYITAISKPTDLHIDMANTDITCWLLETCEFEWFIPLYFIIFCW